MKLRNISGFLLLFFMAFVLTNCEKENIDIIDIVEDPIIVDTTIISNTLLFRTSPGTTNDGLDLDCITILYPFELETLDGSYVTINDEDDFFNSLQDSLSAAGIIDFVYPLNVLDDNGDLTQVNNGEEFAEMFAECIPDGGWTADAFPAYLISDDNSCYTFEYPLSLETLDGTLVQANDECKSSNKSGPLSEILKVIHNY